MASLDVKIYHDDAQKNIGNFAANFQEKGWESKNLQSTVGALQSLATRVDLSAVVNGLLTEILDSNNVDQVKDSVNNNRILLASFRGGKDILFIQLSSSHDPDETLYTYPSTVVIASINGEPLEFTEYEIDRPITESQPFQDRYLTNPTNRSLPPAHPLVVPVNKRVIEIQPNSAALLSLQIGSDQTLIHCFCRKTLKYQNSLISELSSSRAAYLLAMIRQFNTPIEPDAVRAFLSDDSHIVRWEAVKTLAHLDCADIVDILTNMKSDQNYEIRHAARETLEGV